MKEECNDYMNSSLFEWTKDDKDKDYTLNDFDKVREKYNKIKWDLLSYDAEYLSNEFIEEFKDKLDWKLLSEYQILYKKDNIIRKFSEYWDWEILSYRQLLSEEII